MSETPSSLAELGNVGSEGADAVIRLQVEAIRLGRTASDKPFYDLEVADHSKKLKFKIWSNSDAFQFCNEAKAGGVCDLSGHFYTNQYGVNVNRPALEPVSAEEADDFFAGPTQRREFLEAEWTYLKGTFQGLAEPRLRSICTLALEKFEPKWRRAAAARSYHHARRGGLLEHTAQMTRCAQAIAPLYEELSFDLLAAGVLFHDIGKLWENDYEAQGFTSPLNRTGELMGHICLGIEVVNKLWHDAAEADPASFSLEEPPSEVLRDHLLHLIASHHGQREFGAPVTPRTPEAWALHQIDNLDAKMEMLRCAYAENAEVIPGLFEPRRPMEGHPAAPLKLSARSDTPLED